MDKRDAYDKIRDVYDELASLHKLVAFEHFKDALCKIDTVSARLYELEETVAELERGKE